MRTAVVVATAAALAACAPRYRTEVETVLTARHPPVSEPAHDALHAHAGAVGQWALYRISRDGAQIGYQLVDITRGDCGVWIEVVWSTADHRAVSKVCYREMPDLDGHAATWRPLVQAVVEMHDDEYPLLIDLRQPGSAPFTAALQIEKFESTFDGARWKHDVFPREDLTVTAGQFAQTVRAKDATGLTMWFHSDVPITNLVRSHARDGSELELVAFSESGATSVIPDLPNDRVHYVECKSDSSIGHLNERPVCRHEHKWWARDELLGSLQHYR
ncbi:MAG TPA: hypothetical protein VMJ10_15085 [Kofleriaceae bacterium]|nr:hypothetical protein [Kofleriaceae bacterium]